MQTFYTGHTTKAMKLFKDHSRRGYLEVYKETRNHFIGRYKLCKWTSNRYGDTIKSYFIETPVDMTDKIWVKRLHKWERFNQDEVRVPYRFLN